MAKDPQKNRLYKSESCIEGLQEFDSIQRCQNFVDMVIYKRKIIEKYTVQLKKLVTIKQRFNMPSLIIVSDGRARRIACATYIHGYPELKLPKWARSKFVILHEIAHILTWNEGHSHGWQFADCLLFLVKTILGSNEYKKLKASFKEHKVRWKEPKKRILTEEQKQILRERIAKAREAKNNVY